MRNKLRTFLALAAASFSLAVCPVQAQAAGPATNVITLQWDAPTNNYVPYVYEMQQSLSLTNAGAWVTVANNIPSNVLTLTLTVDRSQKWFRVRAVNSTNSAWFSDFSNVASTAWPGSGGNLSIRLGP